MGFLTWVALGLLAGAVAKWLTPGSDPGGCLWTVVLGVAGALLGGFLGQRFGWGSVSGVNFESVALATGGAMLLLLARRVVKGNPGEDD